MNIVYSSAARTMFRGMDLLDDRIIKSIFDEVSRFAWTTIKVNGGEQYTLPLEFCHPDCVEFAERYCRTMGSIFATSRGAETVELSPLQALEVRARSLVMGDVAATIKALIGADLLPKVFSATVSVPNPYYDMVFRSLVKLEQEPTYQGPRVSACVPGRWLTKRPSDRYDVECLHVAGAQGIGLGLIGAPDVPLFDVSDVVI